MRNHWQQVRKKEAERKKKPQLQNIMSASAMQGGHKNMNITLEG